MKVILPDNSERVFEGVNAMDLAKSIGKSWQRRRWRPR